MDRPPKGWPAGRLQQPAPGALWVERGRRIRAQTQGPGNDREYPLDAPIVFPRQQGPPLVASSRDEREARLQVIDLEAGTMKDIPRRWDGLQGASELADGRSGPLVAPPGPRALPVSSPGSMPAGKRSRSGPPAPIARRSRRGARRAHRADPGRAGPRGRHCGVSQDVAEVDSKAKQWKPMGRWASSPARRQGRPARGGPGPSRRRPGHPDPGERRISRHHFRQHASPPARRTRCCLAPHRNSAHGDGLAFYGHGGPLLYSRGTWRAVPKPWRRRAT